MTMLDRYGSYDDGFESWGDDSHVIEEIYDGSLSQRVDSALNAPNPTNSQQRLVKLVEGMTPSQFEAATYDDKHLLVLAGAGTRSEEHTSELQPLMRISSAVFCLKKTIQTYSQEITKRRNKHKLTTIHK